MSHARLPLLFITLSRNSVVLKSFRQSCGVGCPRVHSLDVIAGAACIPVTAQAGADHPTNFERTNKVGSRHVSWGEIVRSLESVGIKAPVLPSHGQAGLGLPGRIDFEVKGDSHQIDKAGMSW